MTMSSGSNSSLVPRPVQSGQAPWGELKEKLRGSISPKLMPQKGQAKFSEKRSSLAVDDLTDGDAAGDAEGDFEGIDDADAVGVFFRGDAGFVADDDAIDDDLDGVLLGFGEVDLLVDLADLAVDADADEALAANLVEDTLVLAFAVADDGGEDHEAGAFGEGEDLARPSAGPTAGRWGDRSWDSGGGRRGRRAVSDSRRSR